MTGASLVRSRGRKRFREPLLLQSPSQIPHQSVKREKGIFEFRHLCVFSDGAVRPSPFGWAGIGFALFTDDGRFIEAVGMEALSKRRLGINRTELWAAIRAMSHVMREMGPSGVVLHTDSQLLVNCANRVFHPRSQKLAEDWGTFQDVVSDHQWVRVVKVDRSHPKMRLPDRYAKEGASLGKRRAQGKYRGPRWQRILSRRPLRGYCPGHK